jgi:hypothetical protein
MFAFSCEGVYFSARRSSKSLWRRRSAVVERDISRKVDWASRADYMASSVARYNFFVEGT